ncbi:MAG: SCO family protein [Betaproteobacteria bacterium]
MRNKLKIIFALSLLAWIGCAQAAAELPYYNSEDFAPHWLKANDQALKTFHSVPAFRFTNQNGKSITEANFKNKIYVASFFFTTCQGICPRLTSKLSQLQKAFPNDNQVRILSHSVMPDVDTVSALKQYAKEHNINSNTWDLVTGNKAAIYAIAKTAYFASEDMGKQQASGDFLHTEKLLLIDQNKRIRGVYNGMADSAIADLVADIKILKAL